MAEYVQAGQGKAVELPHGVDAPPGLHLGRIHPVAFQGSAAETHQFHIHVPHLHSVSHFVHGAHTLHHEHGIPETPMNTGRKSLLEEDYSEAVPKVKRLSSAPLHNVANVPHLHRVSYTGRIHYDKFAGLAEALCPLPHVELKFKAKIGVTEISTAAARRKAMGQSRAMSQTFRQAQAKLSGRPHLNHDNSIIVPLADHGVIMQPLTFRGPQLEVNMAQHLPQSPAFKTGALKDAPDLVGLGSIGLSVEPRRRFQPMEALSLSTVPESILF
ncbi:unnamed protein product [Amoebophrya sp. A120]|nr:unnamed protein product [Amoebophrya sp. A120]|eukprot:GSA120T00022966001.1